VGVTVQANGDERKRPVRTGRRWAVRAEPVGEARGVRSGGGEPGWGASSGCGNALARVGRTVDNPLRRRWGGIESP
jgi:hypothetical protein